MNSASRVTVRWPVLLIAALLLLAVGATLAYVALRAPSPEPHATTDGAIAGPAPSEAQLKSPSSGPLPDVMVTLAPEAVERAGITVTPVGAGGLSGGLRAPGVVEPNAYKEIIVTPLVGGRITRVSAELGQQVKRGHTIAQIFSPELAETQTRYISARAALEAHEQELARTEKLAAIGAASKQELERTHAEHTARRAEVESIASRLQLLGLSSKTIEGLGPGKAVEATTNVPAPIDGVITKREANVGTNVDQATQLFTIVDLSTVWVVADLYEKDFSRVSVGTPATVTTAAYPDLTLFGRVSYIDPQVSPETRTAKVRIEVPNPRQQLRLGMFAEALLGGQDGPSTPTIPRSAVQNVGDRAVVYLAQPKEPGKFVEREVRLGATSGDRIEVLSGLQSSDIVVSEGSFSVRAEVERLGLRAASPSPVTHGSMTMTAASQEVSVAVTESGFEPQQLNLRAAVPARITFTRTSEKTCATKVVFPSLKIERDLPLGKPVSIEFTPAQAGDIEFVCGMNMLRGSIVVK